MGFDSFPRKVEMPIHNGAEGFEDFSKRGREFLLSIDFQALQRIFEERLSKCGIHPESITFLGSSDHIERLPGYLEGWGVEGEYRVLPNGKTILRIPDAIPQTAIGVIARAPKLATSFESWLLSSLVHEISHGVSFNNLKKGEDGSLVNQSGIQRIEKGAGSRGKYESHGLLLNEALTERIAREVFEEYVSRKGLSSEKGFMGRRKYDYKEASAYSGKGKKMYESLITALAKEFETSEEAISNGFEHAYYNGLDFASPEMEQLVIEATSGETYEQLSKARRQEDKHTKRALRLLGKRLGLNT
jgi:hypothetical protein